MKNINTTIITLDGILEALKYASYSCELFLVEYEGEWVIDVFRGGGVPTRSHRRVAVMNPGNGITAAAIETCQQHCWDEVLWAWSPQEAWSLMKTVWGMPHTLPFICFNDEGHEHSPITDYSEGGLNPSEVQKVFFINGRTLCRDHHGRLFDCHPLGASGHAGLYPIRWQLHPGEAFLLPEEVWTPIP